MLAPPRCVACGCEPKSSTAVLCPECERGLVSLGADVCQRCALPRPCAPCPAADASWDTARSALRHGQVSSSVVVAFKQSGSGRLGRLMLKWMLDTAPESLGNGAVLVPVPMDPRRKRKTGVDHAALLARSISRAAGRPALQTLRRSSAPRGVRQAGAARIERLAQHRIQIEPISPSPRRCVVVDDVFTTGATLQATALALRQGGAEVVNCLTFARALPPAYAGKAASSW